MTKKRTPNFSIFFLLLVIAMCVSLIAGATYALFTSESKVNVAVTSGKVEVISSLGDVVTSSMGTEQAFMRARVMGCDGILNATVSRPALTMSGMASLRFRTKVKGPGQKCSASFSASGVKWAAARAISMSDTIIVLTPRPCSVKAVHEIDLGGETPLARRELPGFGKWFERLWKELNE